MFTNDTVTIKCGVTVSILCPVDLKALNERTVTAVIWGEVFRFFRSRAARVELKQQTEIPLQALLECIQPSVCGAYRYFLLRVAVCYQQVGKL